MGIKKYKTRVLERSTTPARFMKDAQWAFWWEFNSLADVSYSVQTSIAITGTAGSTTVTTSSELSNTSTGLVFSLTNSLTGTVNSLKSKTSSLVWELETPLAGDLTSATIYVGRITGWVNKWDNSTMTPWRTDQGFSAYVYKDLFNNRLYCGSTTENQYSVFINQPLGVLTVNETVLISDTWCTENELAPTLSANFGYFQPPEGGLYCNEKPSTANQVNSRAFLTMPATTIQPFPNTQYENKNRYIAGTAISNRYLKRWCSKSELPLNITEQTITGYQTTNSSFIGKGNRIHFGYAGGTVSSVGPQPINRVSVAIAMHGGEVNGRKLIDLTKYIQKLTGRI